MFSNDRKVNISRRYNIHIHIYKHLIKIYFICALYFFVKYILYRCILYICYKKHKNVI